MTVSFHTRRRTNGTQFVKSVDGIVVAQWIQPARKTKGYTLIGTPALVGSKMRNLHLAGFEAVRKDSSLFKQLTGV